MYMFQRYNSNHHEQSLWLDFLTTIKNGNLKKLENTNYPSTYYTRKDSNSGRTALHEAATTTHIKVANFLLENGADINAADMHGATPLHFSVELGPDGMVEFLLSETKKFGANLNINAKDNQGNTALHWAAYSQEKSIFDLLIKQGADATIKNKNGDNPHSLFKGKHLTF
jgi:ankyrin repeat protein